MAGQKNILNKAPTSPLNGAAKPQGLDAKAQRNYETALAQLIKRTHNDMQRHSQVSLYKITSCQSTVNLTDTPDVDQAQQEIKFDLRMDNEAAERDFFKICVIAQIFS